MSIIQENGTQKISINSYLGRKLINEIKEENGIKIQVMFSDIYMDYETYKIKVNNNTSKDILLDFQVKTNTMYVTNDKDVKFSAYGHEISKEELKLLKGTEKEIEIRFSNSHIYNTTIEKISFTNIILDYEEYENKIDKEKYNNIQTIEIEI